MRYTVIVNPNAGRQHMGDALPAIRALLSEDGSAVQVVETQSPAEGRTAVQRAAREGTGCLICCGGDGTLSDTAGWMLETGCTVPLGYIPAGTTNDFAAALHLPKEPVAAARHILQSPQRPLDVGRFGDRTFIYTASFGAFTGASYSADPNLKHALGHLAYVIEGVKELPTLRPYPLRVETAEGERIDGEFIFGSMTNSTSLGGVIHLDPAQVDFSDGRFELLLVKNPRHLGEFNRIVHCLLTGKYDEDGVICLHTAGARFAFNEPVDWSLDGERAQSGAEIALSVEKQAIRLRY